MKTIQIGAFEAKTHFSELLKKTSRGVEYVILLRGKPVAELKAIKGDDRREKSAAALAAIAGFRRSRKPMAIDDIVALVREGRER